MEGGPFFQGKKKMAVVIRLSRHGSHKRPFYRIVATDKQYPRDGRYLEVVGTFDPRKKEGAIHFDRERLDYWLGKGALPSDTVKGLLNRTARDAKAAS